MRLLLIGNPNSGKTTVFNHLTGKRQHIGNFPGITVDFKNGYCGNDEIIDLPGLYSLAPHSAEEAVAVTYLKEHPPDGIINCIDFTNLRRSLPLTLCLAELGIPMIIVANMLEECTRPPDLKRLEQQLGIPIFPIHKQNRWAPAVLLRLIRGEIEHRHRPPLLCRGSAETKYRWIDRHITLPNSKGSRKHRSDRLDWLLMHPFWGFLCFLGIMSLIFDLTFHRLGPLLTTQIIRYPERLTVMAEAIGQPVLRVLIQGAITGVGSVLSFLPTMMVLFFFLAILEDSGYMVRICYLAEHIMNALGLSGKSIVPLLLGFGCSVPAVLSSRTLENTVQRMKTIQLIPFFSCSAKLPIYGTLATLIAPHHAFDIVFLSYLLGIGAGLLTAAISKKERVPLLMELPPYRFPKWKNLWFRLWGQTKAFVQKAFSVLLLTSILTALLQQCTPQFSYTEDPSESLLASMAKILVPLFKAAKLDHWILIAALTAGLFAKESVVSVLAVLSPDLGVFSGGAALPFLIFCILYPPCTATLVTVRKETRSFSTPLLMFGFHFLLALLGATIAARI